MRKSIYTRIGATIKKLLGIKDISLLKKNLHKKIGKLLYHKKYNAAEVVSVMKELGVSHGSVICIHSSMKEFYNYKGTAKELIDLIIEEIGPEGTLMMPAFPIRNLACKPGYIFDAKNDPTGAGYLAEEFRKYPGVLRSINVQHSVCAIGKYANYLTKDHHKTHDCWDKNSPWQRMIELNALVVNLGMPDFYIGTFDHCVESILQYEYDYWSQFFTEEREFMYYDIDGNIKRYVNYTSNIDRRTRESNVTKYFTEDDMKSERLSNLLIKSYNTSKCLNKMLELGRKGIGIYYVPSPRGYKFS